MTRIPVFALMFLTSQLPAVAQDASATSALLRRYQDGQKLTYRIRSLSEDEAYEATASGVVKTDASGRHYEEYVWSKLVRNGKPVALPASRFKQFFSLDPTRIPTIPDLSEAYPGLVGP